VTVADSKMAGENSLDIVRILELPPKDQEIRDLAALEYRGEEFIFILGPHHVEIYTDQGVFIEIFGNFSNAVNLSLEIWEDRVYVAVLSAQEEVQIFQLF
jgi:hypothetical protein